MTQLERDLLIKAHSIIRSALDKIELKVSPEVRYILEEEIRVAIKVIPAVLYTL